MLTCESPSRDETTLEIDALEAIDEFCLLESLLFLNGNFQASKLTARRLH